MTSIPIADWQKSKARLMLSKMDVQYNMISNRLAHGGPLRAEEIVNGIRLSHEDFLYLYDHARRSMAADCQ